MMDSLPDVHGRLPHWLERLHPLWPERIALTDPDSGFEYTYRGLHDRARRTAGTLQTCGVKRGDRVAALMHNGVGVLDLLFACGYLGAILAPLNWRLSRREIGALLDDLEPVFVLADEEFAGLLPEAGLAALQPEILLEGEPFEGAAQVAMDDPWLILYTGGTTGLPKGAVLTHGSIVWNAINTVLSWGLSSTDVAPSFTPMFHTGGLNVFTLPLLLVGGRVILPRRFDPAQALRILVEERPTVMFMVPTMFQLVAEQPEFAKDDLSHLRWAISGGAPLPESVAHRWLPKVPVFKQGYGLTEAGPNNFATSDQDARRNMQHSVGQLTLFAHARIVDDEGANVPDGVPGELLLAGPHICAGYWRRPEATAEAFRGGWFHTGDIAMRDQAGFYYIVDRKKDMIITGGENVYPSEVESVLYSHPSVHEVAVVGLPDERWGEAICAVVSLKRGHSVEDGALKSYMAEHLARYKLPKRFVIVDDLPKSAAGKILRAEAKHLAQTSVPATGDSTRE